MKKYFFPIMECIFWGVKLEVRNYGMREIWSFKKPYTCIFKFLGHYYFVENLKSVFFFIVQGSGSGSGSL